MFWKHFTFIIINLLLQQIASDNQYFSISEKTGLSLNIDVQNSLYINKNNVLFKINIPQPFEKISIEIQFELNNLLADSKIICQNVPCLNSMLKDNKSYQLENLNSQKLSFSIIYITLPIEEPENLKVSLLFRGDINDDLSINFKPIYIKGSLILRNNYILAGEMDMLNCVIKLPSIILFTEEKIEKYVFEINFFADQNELNYFQGVSNAPSYIPLVKISSHRFLFTLNSEDFAPLIHIIFNIPNFQTDYQYQQKIGQLYLREPQMPNKFFQIYPDSLEFKTNQFQSFIISGDNPQISKMNNLQFQFCSSIKHYPNSYYSIIELLPIANVIINQTMPNDLQQTCITYSLTILNPSLPKSSSYNILLQDQNNQLLEFGEAVYTFNPTVVESFIASCVSCNVQEEDELQIYIVFTSKLIDYFEINVPATECYSCQSGLQYQQNIINQQEVQLKLKVKNEISRCKTLSFSMNAFYQNQIIEVLVKQIEIHLNRGLIIINKLTLQNQLIRQRNNVSFTLNIPHQHQFVHLKLPFTIDSHSSCMISDNTQYRTINNNELIIDSSSVILEVILMDVINSIQNNQIEAFSILEQCQIDYGSSEKIQFINANLRLEIFKISQSNYSSTWNILLESCITISQNDLLYLTYPYEENIQNLQMQSLYRLSFRQINSNQIVFSLKENISPMTQINLQIQMKQSTSLSNDWKFEVFDEQNFLIIESQNVFIDSEVIVYQSLILKQLMIGLKSNLEFNFISQKIFDKFEIQFPSQIIINSTECMMNGNQIQFSKDEKNKLTIQVKKNPGFHTVIFENVLLSMQQKFIINYDTTLYHNNLIQEKGSNSQFFYQFCYSHCRICTQNLVCQLCENGYIMEDNECIEYCPQLKIEIDRKCIQCQTDNNCEKCSIEDLKQCNKCKNGYQVVNGLCQQLDQKIENIIIKKEQKKSNQTKQTNQFYPINTTNPIQQTNQTIIDTSKNYQNPDQVSTQNNSQPKSESNQTNQYKNDVQNETNSTNNQSSNQVNYQQNNTNNSKSNSMNNSSKQMTRESQKITNQNEISSEQFKIVPNYPWLFIILVLASIFAFIQKLRHHKCRATTVLFSISVIFEQISFIVLMIILHHQKKEHFMFLALMLLIFHSTNQIYSIINLNSSLIIDPEYLQSKTDNFAIKVIHILTHCITYRVLLIMISCISDKKIWNNNGWTLKFQILQKLKVQLKASIICTFTSVVILISIILDFYSTNSSMNFYYCELLVFSLQLTLNTFYQIWLIKQEIRASELTQFLIEKKDDQ